MLTLCVPPCPTQFVLVAHILPFSHLIRLSKFQQQINDETSRYRDKLAEYVIAFGLGPNAFGSAAVAAGIQPGSAGTSAGQIRGGEEGTRTLLEELIKSYRSRETAMQVGSGLGPWSMFFVTERGKCS